MPSKPLLTWNRRDVPEDLHPLLEALSRDGVLSEETHNAGTLVFLFEATSRVVVYTPLEEDRHRITCGSIATAARGLGLALSGRPAREEALFRSLGVMLDCSRNAVMKVDHLKRWLRQLALLGYNRLMLYTEETYQLPGEPFFGYMRGGYSLEEIREIDDHAASLGIEVIACIQTLGHLHQILKWPRFRDVRDTDGVLLVGEEASLALIERMVGFWEEALRSRRIHIGMDEAHDIGRGRFLDRNGWQPPFEIFNRHLQRVSALCKQRGLRPMIWSDMFFRMGNSGQSYYDPETVIPDEIKTKIPPSVDLVYWDYYHQDEAFYRDWIRRHRELGNGPVVASGLWTWLRFWYDHATTRATVEPCIRACRAEGVEELFFTMWGDGGSYCEFDSAFAGLAWAADLAHGGNGEEEAVAPMVRHLCGSDYRWLLLGTRLEVDPGGDLPRVAPSTILWDDPLLGIGWQGYPSEAWPRVLEALERLRNDLQMPPASGDAVDGRYLCDLVEVLLAKLAFRQRLVAAYDARDHHALRLLQEDELPRVRLRLRDLATSFRRQWLRRNKPFGMEVIQIRFGALDARCEETARRIGEHLSGERTSIEELEARPAGVSIHPVKYFYHLATGSSVI